MKKLIKKLLRSNLRTKLLTVFSALLFFSFFLIGLVFNIAVTHTIRSNADSQLDALLSDATMIRFIMDRPDSPPSGDSNAADDGQIRNIFKLPHNSFVINDDFDILWANIVDTTDPVDILEKLKNESVLAPTMNMIRVSTLNGVYYVKAQKWDMPDSGATYSICYVDVTSLSRFAHSVNVILLILVGVIWVMALLATTILAGTIAKPIRKLSLFASRIGNGDFSTNNFKFYDEELDNLNERLNQAAGQLGVYDSEQKTFFQNVSHELRTPLMSIKCYAEGIKDGVMSPDDASQTILSETDRLTGMVDDLLYISRIDNVTHAYQTEKADLREILGDCVERQRVLAKSNNIDFDMDMEENPVTIICNRKLLSRATANLISNAIRYAKSLIKISCHAIGSEAVVIINDDGDGIDPEILPNVFNRFFRGPNGNHGIGLSIVKSAAEQHGGSVSAENTDSGAVFTVKFPIAH
jgi:signal transduction histidine kinase